MGHSHPRNLNMRDTCLDIFLIEYKMLGKMNKRSRTHRQKAVLIIISILSGFFLNLRQRIALRDQRPWITFHFPLQLGYTDMGKPERIQLCHGKNWRQTIDSAQPPYPLSPLVGFH